MSTVLRVNPWEKDGKTRYFVDLDDGGTKVETVSFSEKALELKVGEALPAGWILEAPKQEGWKPMLKAPKDQRGGGFKGRSPELEHFIQERMDRRTALMQAVAVYAQVAPPNLRPDKALWAAAGDMYDWLRQTVPPSSYPAGKPGGDTPLLGDGSASSPGNLSTDQGNSGTRVDPGSSPGRAGSVDDVVVQGPEGEAGSCPPHELDMTVAPKAGGRRPCVKCKAWVR